MEALYEAVHTEQPLSQALLKRLNETQGQMEEQWGQLSRERAREDVDAPHIEGPATEAQP